MNNSFSLIVLGLIIIFACLALALVPDMLSHAISALLSATVLFTHLALALLSIAGLVSLAYGVFTARERILSMREQRRKEAHEVITAPANHQVWVHSFDGQYRNLALDARVVIAEQLPTEMEMQAWMLWQSMHATANRQAINAGQQLLEAVQPVDLLSFLRPVKRGLIVGASDSGKTTLLKWMIEERAHLGHVIVIDPHAGPNTWPCEVIGRGSDHAAISRALDGFIALMVRRYKQIGCGEVQEESHRLITIFVDEWMAIADECDNAAYVFRRLLAEARKANIHLWLGAQSERVEPLGLKGRGDLKEGLVIVRLNYNQLTGERSAVVRIKYDDHTETIPAILPGQFNGSTWTVEQPRLELPEPELSNEEQSILSMREDGLSMKQISESVWGVGKFGSFYNQKIADVLNKWARS